jgi:hypothetical protein
VSNLLEGLELPYQLQWVDEFKWSPLGVDKARALDGSLVYWNGPLVSGRPITLEAPPDACWIGIDTVRALHNMSSSPREYLLVWEGVNYNVIFDAKDGVAIDLVKVHFGSSYYYGKINLMQVPNA